MCHKFNIIGICVNEREVVVNGYYLKRVADVVKCYVSRFMNLSTGYIKG